MVLTTKYCYDLAYINGNSKKLQSFTQYNLKKNIEIDLVSLPANAPRVVVSKLVKDLKPITFFVKTPLLKVFFFAPGLYWNILCLKLSQIRFQIVGYYNNNVYLNLHIATKSYFWWFWWFLMTCDVIFQATDKTIPIQRRYINLTYISSTLYKWSFSAPTPQWYTLSKRKS